MDSRNGKYPCLLSTTNWLYEYEQQEWLAQAKSLTRKPWQPLISQLKNAAYLLDIILLSTEEKNHLSSKSKLILLNNIH